MLFSPNILLRKGRDKLVGVKDWGTRKIKNLGRL